MSDTQPFSCEPGQLPHTTAALTGESTSLSGLSATVGGQPCIAPDSGPIGLIGSLGFTLSNMILSNSTVEGMGKLLNGATALLPVGIHYETQDAACSQGVTASDKFGTF